MDPDKLSGVFGGALRRNASKRNPSDADKIVGQFKANGLSEDEALKKALPLINALESERKYGLGGAVKKAAQAAKAAAKAAEEAAKVAKPLERAPAKKKEEIRSIAERVAPQVTGEYVRSKPGSATTVAGKTKKQFEREKSLPVDVRPMLVDLKPEQVDIESLKGNVVIGIPGDPTIAGKELYGAGDVVLERPSPQYGGPLYGMYSDKDQFWASGLGAARRVQNLAKEAAEQYGLPVVGKYIMMGPESINYAQHFADANLQAIDLSKMTRRQVEGFNRLIRQGSPSSGPRPSFPGIEDKEAAYLHLAEDPELRKHFNQLMQQNTVVDAFNLPSGQDIRFAVTEPELRNLETGVTGYSLGRMSPEIKGGLELSAHPTYSHDIPGKFLGSSKYPIPYELSFPDTLKSIRENPAQAPHEFGSLKMVGPRQVVDQQLIDEIKAYEEAMKALTGKKAGGAVEEQEFSGGGIAKLAKAAKAASKAAAKAPQEAALETARKNAVKMLGLPESNTAADRAKALGFTAEGYHGTTGDIKKFEPQYLGESTGAQSAKKAFFFAQDPKRPPANLLVKAPPQSKSVQMLRDLGVPEEEIAKLNQVSMKGHGAETASGYSALGGSREYKEAMRKAKAAEKSRNWSEYEKWTQVAEDAEIGRSNELQDLVAKYGEARDLMLDRINNAILNKPLPQEQATELDAKMKQLMPYGWYNSYSIPQLKALKGEVAKLAGPEYAESALKSIDDFISVKANRQLAEQYQQGSNVIPAELRYKNPMVHDFGGSVYRDQSYADLIDEAKRLGHDALILQNTYDPGAGPAKLIDVTAVFDPSQIRSRFAAFDPAKVNDPDILGGADPSLLAAIATGGGGLAVLGMNKDKEKGKKK